MRAVLRRSLLAQLLGVYLVFVVVVLGIDYKVNEVAQQQVRSQVQSTDVALAQQIALDTDAKLRGAEAALVQLSRLPSIRRGNSSTMQDAFAAFTAARRDVDLVYWLSPNGTMQVSVPTDIRTLGADFSNGQAFQAARRQTGPLRAVMEDGIVDLTTFHAVVTLAVPVRKTDGTLRGILATNLRLDDLDQSLQPVIASEGAQHQHILLSIVDAHGRLIGTPERERLLQSVLGELPGASEALGGHIATRAGTDSNGEAWLYSSVPIHGVGWAVVVQRSSSDALAVITNFRRWITVAAVLFAAGGLLFWLVLLLRVVRPLRLLARRHQVLSTGNGPPHGREADLLNRGDEIGALARSLSRLERDVIVQLAELRTLLETSKAVVDLLDPIGVGRTIIQEVQRLVDIQAAAVMVPDEAGVLRVLVSEGRGDQYDREVEIQSHELDFPSARSLHSAEPVQLIAGIDERFPEHAYAAGFRAILSIPIISRHVGSVALVVQRTRPLRFTSDEIDLLLTFANFATLAWEHAVLYDRSDVRLREVARENEDLYRQANSERQTLAAIMRSMSDGLILTSVDGGILFANPGAATLAGLEGQSLAGTHIDRIYQSLLERAGNPAVFERMLAGVRAGESPAWTVEWDDAGRHRAVALTVFDVRDESGSIIGRGLLLRDVTRERELDRFKTTLLAAVGHELRTPLAVIKGYASTLLQDDVKWARDDERSFLNTISSETDRLAQLVSNLLDLSRLESGLLTLQRSPHRVDDIVSSVIRRLHLPVAQLAVSIAPDLPAAEVDRQRIEVVLHNLITNALTYGGSRVEIGAVSRGDRIIVRVTDDGPGISPDELPHIFERFYRTRHGSERHSAGTGLGLAISKAFVEAHGGEIWAESGVNGTTISFSMMPVKLRLDGARNDAGETAELHGTARYGKAAS